MAFPRSYLFLLDPIDVEDTREIELLSDYLDLLEKLELPSRLQASTREDTGPLSVPLDNILIRQMQDAASARPVGSLRGLIYGILADTPNAILLLRLLPHVALVQHIDAVLEPVRYLLEHQRWRVLKWGVKKQLLVLLDFLPATFSLSTRVLEQLHVLALRQIQGGDIDAEFPLHLFYHPDMPRPHPHHKSIQYAKLLFEESQVKEREDISRYEENTPQNGFMTIIAHDMRDVPLLWVPNVNVRWTAGLIEVIGRTKLWMQPDSLPLYAATIFYVLCRLVLEHRLPSSMEDTSTVGDDDHEIITRQKVLAQLKQEKQNLMEDEIAVCEQLISERVSFITFLGRDLLR
ncbi:hypothetical protein M427DRAFT_71176, partial [Gonapodya prolifera JEL478]